jgi:hypothetical protein
MMMSQASLQPGLTTISRSVPTPRAQAKVMQNFSADACVNVSTLPKGRLHRRSYRSRFAESRFRHCVLERNFRVLGGPYKGHTAVDRYYLTDKARWKLKSLLHAIDVTVSDSSELRNRRDARPKSPYSHS